MKRGIADLLSTVNAVVTPTHAWRLRRLRFAGEADSDRSKQSDGDRGGGRGGDAARRGGHRGNLDGHGALHEWMASPIFGTRRHEVLKPPANVVKRS